MFHMPKLEHTLKVDDGIILSEVLPSDKPAIMEHLKERSISENLANIPYPFTNSDADAWIQNVNDNLRAQGKLVSFAIRNVEGLLIGGTGFDGLIIGQSHRAELQYWLARQYWGLGITKTITAFLCNHAFAEFGLLKITATTLATNMSAQRVLLKCGFEQEGHLVKHLYRDGQLFDAKIFARFRNQGSSKECAAEGIC